MAIVTTDSGLNIIVWPAFIDTGGTGSSLPVKAGHAPMD